jgi:hypothetical protein
MLQEAIRKPLSGANGLSLCRCREQLHATAQRTNRLPRNLGQPANLGSYGVLDGYHVAVRDTPPAGYATYTTVAGRCRLGGRLRPPARRGRLGQPRAAARRASDDR